MIRVFFLLFISVLCLNKLDAQQLRPTHYSSGEIQSLLINGYRHNLCQLLQLVIDLNSNGTEKNTVVYISSPLKREDSQVLACLTDIFYNTHWKLEDQNKILKKFRLSSSVDSRKKHVENSTYPDSTVNLLLRYLPQTFDQWSLNENKVLNALSKSKNQKSLIEDYLNYQGDSLKGNIQVHWYNKVHNFKFPQDAFMSFRDKDDFRLFNTPSTNGRSTFNLRVLLQKIKKSMQFDVQQSEVFFDGGNTIVSPSLTLIGGDMIKYFGDNVKEEQEKLESYLNSDTIIYLANKKCELSKLTPFRISDNECSNQPHYHLDLFMNMLERKNDYVFIFGIAEAVGDKDYKTTINQFNQRIGELVTFLEGLGSINSKKVICDFIPLFIQEVGTFPHTYTFNNGLIEYIEGDPARSYVYLPYYSNLSTDMEAVRLEISNTYEKYGFVTDNIQYIYSEQTSGKKGFDNALHDIASMHCLLKVLKRSTPDISH